MRASFSFIFTSYSNVFFSPKLAYFYAGVSLPLGTALKVFFFLFELELFYLHRLIYEVNFKKKDSRTRVQSFTRAFNLQRDPGNLQARKNSPESYITTLTVSFCFALIYPFRSEKKNAIKVPRSG